MEQYDLFMDVAPVLVPEEPETGPDPERVPTQDVHAMLVTGLAIGQDISALMAISAYTYDLSDNGFLAYAERRGVLYVAGHPGARMWNYFLNTGLTLDDWLRDPEVAFAREHEGKRHAYSQEELRSQWTAVRIGRGKLEDCWRIWKSSGEEA